MCTKDSSRPIGVFDSGLGGISVLRALHAYMPNERYLYMGDSKHAPYGTKRTEEVYRLSKQWVDYFVERDAKAVVIACNTATSAAAARLREAYADLPIIGLEPALKPAATAFAGTNQPILVMATDLTLREEKFRHLLQQYEAQSNIRLLPAPGLVELVEQGELNTPAMEAYLTEILTPFLPMSVAAVVLGCTHFPFAVPTIRKILGDSVQFFDGAEGTARQLKRQLSERGLLCETAGGGSVELANSEETAEKERLAHRLFEME